MQLQGRRLEIATTGGGLTLEQVAKARALYYSMGFHVPEWTGDPLPTVDVPQVPPPPPAPVARTGGPGTILKNILSGFDLNAEGCGCMKVAADMDQNGAQWCRDNFGALEALIVQNAKRPLVGWGIDHFGRKLFLVISFLFYALAMGLFAIAQNVSMLYLARFVQGIGSSLLWIPAYTVATELSERDWGRAVGSVDMSSNRGGFFGSFIGFGLMLLVNPFELAWKISFVVYGLMTLVASFLTWRGVPETRAVNKIEMTGEEDQLDRNRILRLMAIVLLTSISSVMISPLLMIFLQDRFTSDVGDLARALSARGRCVFLSTRLYRPR